MAPLILEFYIFLAIGLGILVFEAHRQFNSPAYSKSFDGEPTGDHKSDYIFSLAPSEIRSRSAFFSAELVYILVIVAVYLLLISNDAFKNVLAYIVDLQSNQSPPAIPDATTGASSGAVEATESGAIEATNSGAPSAIDQAAAPFVVSVTMVTALRFPLVRRLEVLLRSSAQRLFGIPWIPHRLRQKIQDTPISLEWIEADAGQDGGAAYSASIRRYEASARAAGVSQKDFGDFAAQMAKLAAYQIWVNELKIWPSAEFRSDYQFFHDLNDPLSDQINALFKDCDLLSSAVQEHAEAEPGVDHEERRRMRQELWVLKARQSKDLARKMAAMTALYDQNSKWPDGKLAGATSLRTFLESVRAKDEARVFQINLAILLLMISALVSFIAGYVHAGWLASIARELGLYEQVGADDPQFDRFLTARNFMVSALIVYGLSMWVALDIRRRMMRREAWTNPFEDGAHIPPMGQLALFFGAVAGIVFLVNWAYLLLASPGWSFFGDFREEWWANVEQQANLSLLFAFIAGFHGTAVALMMDLGAKRAEARTWILVAGCYIAAMMLLGYGLGQYYSVDSDELIRRMRELLYAGYLGLIALFTTVAMTSLVRPSMPKPRFQPAMREGAG